MYFSCFWPSYGSKLLLGLLILNIDSFGWWSLSELTSFCFIPDTYVSLYCGILYTKGSLEEVNFYPLNDVHLFSVIQVTTNDNY